MLAIRECIKGRGAAFFSTIPTPVNSDHGEVIGEISAAKALPTTYLDHRSMLTM